WGASEQRRRWPFFSDLLEAERAILLFGAGVLELQDVEPRERLADARAEQTETLQVRDDAHEQRLPEVGEDRRHQHRLPHVLAPPTHRVGDLVADETVTRELAR